MQPPSIEDVVAACREPKWFTAEEVKECIESGRAVNSFVMAPPVVKIGQGEQA
jgi:hypothetical protein